MRKLVVITYRWFIDPPTLLQLVKKAALNALKYGFDISYGCDCPLFFWRIFCIALLLSSLFDICLLNNDVPLSIDMRYCSTNNCYSIQVVFVSFL